jgi:hypothetical protein
MKMILLVAFILILIYSCSPKSYCTSKENYVIKVDTTQPYKVVGTYCVSEKKDTILNDEHGAIEFNVFDRITGKQLNDGVVWLIRRDTTKISFNQKYSNLTVGRYLIFVSGVNNLPLKISEFIIKKNKIYKMNCFLGNSLQR